MQREEKGILAPIFVLLVMAACFAVGLRSEMFNFVYLPIAMLPTLCFAISDYIWTRGRQKSERNKKEANEKEEGENAAENTKAILMILQGVLIPILICVQLSRMFMSPSLLLCLVTIYTLSLVTFLGGSPLGMLPVIFCTALLFLATDDYSLTASPFVYKSFCLDPPPLACFSASCLISSGYSHSVTDKQNYVAKEGIYGFGLADCPDHMCGFIGLTAGSNDVEEWENRKTSRTVAMGCDGFILPIKGGIWLTVVEKENSTAEKREEDYEDKDIRTYNDKFGILGYFACIVLSFGAMNWLVWINKKNKKREAKNRRKEWQSLELATLEKRYEIVKKEEEDPDADVDAEKEEKTEEIDVAVK